MGIFFSLDRCLLVGDPDVPADQGFMRNVKIKDLTPMFLDPDVPALAD